MYNVQWLGLKSWAPAGTWAHLFYPGGLGFPALGPPPPLALGLLQHPGLARQAPGSTSMWLQLQVVRQCTCFVICVMHVGVSRCHFYIQHIPAQSQESVRLHNLINFLAPMTPAIGFAKLMQPMCELSIANDGGEALPVAGHFRLQLLLKRLSSET